DYVINIFQKEKINENAEDMNLVVHRLNRVVKILELLNQQVSILDTMTPLDFLEFRNLLTPSSGFQSLQFRLIEARLGLTVEQRHQKDYYKRTGEGGFNGEDFAAINAIENENTILSLISKWLERMPFFEPEYWSNYRAQFPMHQDFHVFWSDYRALYQASLSE